MLPLLLPVGLAFELVAAAHVVPFETKPFELKSLALKELKSLELNELHAIELKQLHALELSFHRAVCMDTHRTYSHRQGDRMLRDRNGCYT
mmetsp:Transcript_39700/g.79348  ORF Transcript_39700/g.79348 Transcript_39700/m.79348 type:complete len:91 (+) Transcript_39700:107-379(+)